jgi:predicted ATPase
MAAGHGGQILVSAPAAEQAGAPPHPLSLIDLGRYRLRSLDQPEHLYQLAGPRLRRDFPPLDSPAATAAVHLPSPLSSFVGRAQEVEEVVKLVRGARLITLTGEGGVGKTRLALEVAARLQGQFPDGIWAVELEDVTGPELIARRVADGLDLDPAPGAPLEEAVADHLAPLAALLVVDNCEHLLAGVAGLVGRILTRAAQVRVLTTSRERLGLSGEAVYRVPSMPVPDVDADPDTARLSDAVRLFFERAELVSPGIRLGTATVRPVIEVCRRLEGIPLAIELAAALAGALTVDQIAEGIGRQLDLIDRSGAGAGRHGTLAAAVSWSVRLLAPEERRLFAVLSVFRGGFDPDAVATVAAEPGGSLAGLASLADKSLIRREPEGGRFRMLETLRVFAEASLPETERETFRDQHADHYGELADRAAAGASGAELGRWLDRLDREHGNLLAAFEWAIAQEHTDLALRLCLGCAPLWKQRGHAAAGRSRLEQALALPGSAVPLQARGHFAAGDLAADVGDVAEARRHLEEARRLAGEQNDPSTRAWALARLASIAHKEADLVAAAGLFEQALAEARDGDDHRMIGHVLASLALLTADQGRVDDARALAAEALERSRATGDAYAVADALLTGAEIALIHGEAGNGRQRAAEALELGLREGLGDVTAWALGYLGRAALLGGDPRAGRALLEAALERFERVGTPMGRPWVLRHLALVDWWTGAEAAAARRIADGLEAAAVYVRPEVPMLLEVGGWVLARRSPEAAARLLGSAAAQRQTMGLVLGPFEAERHAEALGALGPSLDGGAVEGLLAAGVGMAIDQAVALLTAG